MFWRKNTADSSSPHTLYTVNEQAYVKVITANGSQRLGKF